MTPLEKDIAKLLKKHGAEKINEIAARIVQQPFGDPPACPPGKVWNPFTKSCVDPL